MIATIRCHRRNGPLEDGPFFVHPVQGSIKTRVDELDDPKKQVSLGASSYKANED